ncbi:transmembrane protein 268 [Bombina bombina]|uniref:transmembrane protein 268 n=1 Tax=Bombina bombina TaxID=8345 RepID=UPI00235AF4CB|nr:transmembrane protein 268 [Bombina bombina]XP_053552000.1 transmembrane protein 268 [Bombina bombina]
MVSDNEEAGGDDERISLHSGLYNGRLLSVLPYTSQTEDTEQCLRTLQECGINVPLEQCQNSLQMSPLVPELHRYIIFSSRGFGMVLSLILYISLWVNLYSTVQMFTDSHSWLTSIPVTLAAAVFTSVVILIINRHHKKINVNMDIRLAAANEIFIEHNVLLGISDQMHNCYSNPSLYFIYFHLWGCQQRLSQCLAAMRPDSLQRCLDQLLIVIEIPADSMLDEDCSADLASEETTLLPSQPHDKPILYSKKIPLIVKDEPQVMARQLLIMSSACYVRLLISGRLPRAKDVGHANVPDVPCPCQFIEHSMFWSSHCS